MAISAFQLSRCGGRYIRGQQMPQRLPGKEIQFCKLPIIFDSPVEAFSRKELCSLVA